MKCELFSTVQIAKELGVHPMTAYRAIHRLAKAGELDVYQSGRYVFVDEKGRANVMQRAKTETRTTTTIA